MISLKGVAGAVGSAEAAGSAGAAGAAGATGSAGAIGAEAEPVWSKPRGVNWRKRWEREEIICSTKPLSNSVTENKMCRNLQSPHSSHLDQGYLA